MDNVDLKIAEALGIPFIIKRWTWPITGPFIHKYESETEPHYSEDINTNGFEWSLTGPDAGNTRDVIEKELAKTGLWYISSGYNPWARDSERFIYCLITVGDEPKEYKFTAPTAPLALREAAAKALGV